MWFSWIGFLTGFKTPICSVYLCSGSCMNTNALIHSHMYHFTNPVSWNKKSCMLSWGFPEVLAFFKYFALVRPGLWWKPGWGLHADLSLGGQSAQQAIILICHSLTECSVQCSIRERARTSLGLKFEAVATVKKTCYVNDSKVNEMCWERNLDSSVLFEVWGRARELREDRISDFHRIKPEEMCWFTLKLRALQLAGMRKVLQHTFTTGSQPVLNRH